MTIETTTDVEEISSVNDGSGNRVPPASAPKQEAIRDRLGNWAGGVDGEATDDGTGSTLPAGAVPDGVTVVVQAKRDNSSAVAVGLTADPTVTIAPGEGATYKVTDTSLIHITAQSAGDGVNYTHEA